VSFATCIREPLPERDLVGEDMPWVDLASACQLDPPPSTIRTIGDKKLGFEKENQSLEIKSKVF
jgi:hypothetical protein